MARTVPRSFFFAFTVKFETNIRGHHVYKDVWTPTMGETLNCKPDEREEAKEYDTNAIGVYKPKPQVTVKDEDKTDKTPTEENEKTESEPSTTPSAENEKGAPSETNKTTKAKGTKSTKDSKAAKESKLTKNSKAGKESKSIKDSKAAKGSKAVKENEVAIEPVSEEVNKEVVEIDSNDMGEKDEDFLVGHLPIELSKLTTQFLKSDKNNTMVAKVTGKRKRELGLVVPAKFLCFSTNSKIAKIFYDELVKKKCKYSYLELNVHDYCNKKTIEFE